MTKVHLPILHEDQVKAFLLPGRFRVVRCGRRWGKTDLAKTIACDGVIKREEIGWFAPDYKIQRQAFREIVDMLEPVKKRSSQQDWLIETKTGGRLDFWTLENERAGRSRRYHKVIIDEGAFTKPNVMDIWEQSIAPTLLDYEGEAWVLSNTNGNDPENFLWRICNEKKHGFVEYHAPSYRNPHVPMKRINETPDEYLVRREETYTKLKADNHPLVYQQEYLAEFVDWSGIAFFGLDKLLVDGQPVEHIAICDAVFAVVDTAVKTGKDNDGTAVAYFAVSRHSGHPLVIVDWEIAQIEGDLLEAWLPNVFKRLEQLAGSCRARMGSIGTWIEDAQTGQVLIMAGERRGWPVHAIDTKLTSVGKDERAISVSGYVFRGEVKVSREAYDKVTNYKGTTRNHFMSQVLGFRIGDKTPNRADDLLDTFTYGISIALGDSEGI